MNSDLNEKMDVEIVAFADDFGYEISAIRDGKRLDRINKVFRYIEIIEAISGDCTQLNLHGGAWIDFGTLRYSVRNLLKGKTTLSLHLSDGTLREKLHALHAEISAVSYTQLLNTPAATTLNVTNVAREDWTPYIEECLANNARMEVVQALDSCGAYGALGQHVLPKILPLAELKDISILGHLAAALGFMGKSSPDVMTVLKRLSYHPEPYVKAMAVQALDRLTAT